MSNSLSSLTDYYMRSLTEPDEFKKWNTFVKKTGVNGKSFGDAEVQRAVNAGYSVNDVNDYLKWSGITPSGNFGVAGYNKTQVQGGSGDGAGFSTKESPYYRYFGSATAAPTTPTAPAAPNTPDTPAATPNPETAPGNPALTIPGVNVRLTGENIGIKVKNSSARRSGQINKGTSRLTIPRSAGANSLNIG